MDRRDIAKPATKGVLSGWPMVAVFMVFFLLSFVDRAIISLMVEPIERDLKLTDVEMSLLLGPAFGVLYAFAGLPIGSLLDRYSRRWITMGMVVVWGVATMISGTASSFAILFASRLGIGAGEAALSPAAFTMIGEQMPARRLSTAYSVYTIGAFVGGGLAIVGGGWIIHALDKANSVAIPGLGQFYPWQVAFLIVGTLTVVCAPLALLPRENRREWTSREVVSASNGRHFIAMLLEDPMFYIGYPFAFGSINVLVVAFQSWTPAFMERSYGWNIGDVSFAYGLVQGVSGVIGLIAMGTLVDRLYNRGMVDAHARVPAIGLLISVIAMTAGILSGSPTAFLIASSLFWGLTYTYIGYAPAALQLQTPAPFRARIGALYITFLAVLGTFVGPTMVSWLTQNVLQDRSLLGISLIIVMAIWTPISLLALFLASKRLRARHALASNAEDAQQAMG
jgi:MFS family permease